VLYKNTCYTECPRGTSLYGGVECLSKEDASADAWGRSALVYFPIIIIMICGLGVSVGSEIYERKSSFLSNSIAVWGILELPAFVTQLVLALELEVTKEPTALVYIGI
jgi:hypothetical protein